MTFRRSLLAMSATALLAAAVAGPVMAQSPSTPASSPVASLPAGPTITVEAREYAFGGLPTSVPVGTTLQLQNTGTEYHELILARKNDGVTQTWDELLQMSEQDAFQYITVVGNQPLIAAPGTTADGGLTLTQTGDYLAVCFVPQGTTSLASPAPGTTAAPAGPPHFVLGMRQEFVVTDAGSSPGPVPSPAPMPMGSEPATSSAP